MSKAWVLNKSTIRACGLPRSMRIDFKGLRLSCTLMHSLVTTRVSSVTRAEISASGRSITLRFGGRVGEWSSWFCAAEASVVMLRKLTWIPWWTTRRLASSNNGIMWPMPGLARTATWDWGFMVSERENEREWKGVK